MAAFIQRFRFSLGSLLVLLGLPIGAGLAQSPLQPESAPLYSPDAPPPRRSPLPDRRQDVDEQSIGNDYRVSALQADSQGALWVGSWQGLAKINPSTGAILSRISLPNTTIGALAQDRSGRIWVGTYEGLSRIDPKTGAITAQNFALPSNRVLSLLVDQRGYLWVGTDGGLALISPDLGLLMTTVKNLPGVSANALSLDALGNLWVGTLDGLVQIDTAKGLILRTVANLPGTTVQSLASSPLGTLWIGTPTNLLEADLGIQRTVEMVQIPAAKQAGKQTGKQATKQAGSKKQPAHPPTRKATMKPTKGSDKTAKAAAKVATPPPQFTQRVVFRGTDPNQFKLRTVGKLQGRNVTTLHFDKDKTVWVGTTTGLLRVNPFNGAVGGEIPYLPSSRILSVAPDTGGKLWVGTTEGLGWVNTTTFRGHPHQTFLPAGK